MLINQETDYALRILRALSVRGLQTAADLSQHEQIPLQFTYKILKKLHQGGFIQILRGRGGGYLLAVSLAQVSLYQLIQIMEEPFHVSQCLLPNHKCPWREARDGLTCQAHQNLMALQHSLEEHIRRITLQEVLFQEIHPVPLSNATHPLSGGTSET